MIIRYATVCSGIDAPALAWSPIGWQQVFCSEIDRFPSEVLEHHNPDIPNLWDMTQIKGEDYAGTIDVLCGGTPCQDFSGAGKGEGMAGERGGLTLAFVTLVGQIRPAWVVWENVPGVLSSNDGRDFARFLHEMAEVGYFGAWRVLDAQYFRLAQRRKRVFAVFCPGNWQRAAAVLFEPESMSGDPAPSRETGEGFTYDVAPSLTSNGRGVERAVETRGQDPVIAHALRGEGLDASEDGTGRGTPLVPVHCPGVSPALKARDFKGPSSDGDGDGAPILAFSCKDHAADAGEIAPTLRSMGHDKSHANAGGQLAGAFDLRGREGGAMPEGPYPTANIRAASGDSSRSYVIHGTQDPIVSDIGHALGRNSGQENALVEPSMVVRRLTPRECERLQGFPEIRRTATIRVWSTEHQKNCAIAETSNRRSQKSALSADERESLPDASVAVSSSNTSHQDHEKHADLTVRVDLERSVVLIHNPKKHRCDAKDAGPSDMFRLLGSGGFVQLVAGMPKISGQTTLYGKAELPANTQSSMRQKNGNILVHLCGREIEGLVNDAERFTKALAGCTKSTTSNFGETSRNSDADWAIWSCCVIAAISSFIPEKTRNASSYDLHIETTVGFTAIPWRGKDPWDCPDGPRYKALGNSMAVPVMRWIGERITIAMETTRI